MNQLEFALEYEGSYAVSSQGGNREIDRLHGSIVNQLAVELRKRGYHVNNQPVKNGLRPDIVARKQGQFLIEVKRRHSSTDITSTIGQLLAYSMMISGKTPMPMFAVMPLATASRKLELLAMMDIDIILWDETDGRFEFLGLDGAFGAPDE